MDWSTVSAVLSAIGQIASVLVLLSGIIAFTFRESIKHLFARSLGKELADHAQRLQRELEAYKVTLIAESERAKATQEVKKALALRISERRYNMLTEYQTLHIGFDIEVAFLVRTVQMTSLEYQKRHSELIDRCNEYGRAAVRILHHLDPELRQEVIAAGETFSTALNERITLEAPRLDKDAPALLSMYARSRTVERLLKALLDDMEKMG